MSPEHNQSNSAFEGCLQCGFFLRKKPLEGRASDTSTLIPLYSAGLLHARLRSFNLFGQSFGGGHAGRAVYVQMSHEPNCIRPYSTHQDPSLS